MQRESMEYDVVIVGAGPAGLSCAIRLKQLASDLRVCIIEKGAEVGSHILSGNVFEPRALDELLPNWRELGAPLDVPVIEDRFLLLTESRVWTLPTPPSMNNHGNYVISLANLCRWLAQQAEQLGVDIFPGFAATELLRDEKGIRGIVTGDKGVGKNGEPLATYQPGIEIHAKITVLSEGCRGSLTEKLIQDFDLRKGVDPQTYGLGIKEIWRVPAKIHHPGLVIHTVGWPLDKNTYGGAFLYHMNDQQILCGMVVGLDYQNPSLSPFEEMQRFKTHPAFRVYFENGERIAYGARALNEGGWQSIPQLQIPGLLLAGDNAGFLNVAKIKGSHTAMKSGMLAAETAVDEIQQKINAPSLRTRLDQSWVIPELYRVRNIRPGFRAGLYVGLMNAAFETYIFRGKTPWTLHHHPDHLNLKPAQSDKKIVYPKPDHKITFDRLSSVYLTNTFHEENQPCHLKLKDEQAAINVNLKLYNSPETLYCPANVYEIVYTQSQEARLQINAQNCIHCKTCDIKDPIRNITWIPPEGGGGPNYTNM